MSVTNINYSLGLLAIPNFLLFAEREEGDYLCHKDSTG